MCCTVQILQVFSTLLIFSAYQVSSSYLHEHLCTCGTVGNENIGIIDCARLDEDYLTGDMLNAMYGTRLVNYG